MEDSNIHGKYRNYGAAARFDIRRGMARKSRDGTILLRVSKRVNCMARITLKLCGRDEYVIDGFREDHTHPLVTEEFKIYLKVNRKLGVVHQNFILDCVRVNVGPMRCFRISKEVVGGYSNVGATGDDFKNFSRNLRAYISGCDAQIVLNKMFLKKKSCSSFFFEYLVDKDDSLTTIFWADLTARRNYAIFGDVVSFDSTYKTIRYEMIFAPFTGKDNHGKIVTFGAALMSAENHESYEWVFQKFKDCMRRQPNMIITDQDHAMKIAMHVFPDTRHHLCMWHIMLKVLERLPAHLKKDESFKKRFNALNDIIMEYGLDEESWFRSMFAISQFWISAYFRDHPMSGICRTTSISESMNSFFNNYLNYGANLVEFMMHFESAMDAQRNAYDLQNSIDHSTLPKTNTPWKFEHHAATIYTTKMFVKVQEEIERACYNCNAVSIEHEELYNIYGVDDGGDQIFVVSYDKIEDTAVCDYMKFVRKGLLCCHIFVLFKQFKWDDIPKKYVVSRWTRAAHLNPLDGIGDPLLERLVNSNDCKNMTNQMISDFYACVAAVEGDMDKMHILIRGMKELKDVLVSGDAQAESNSLSKSKLFELFYDCSRRMK
ncbi:hypothetical protein C2S52_013480 [Perilla frutescens var. hirtella]|nr:hypothetical protein C2S52_013480 [Perilla frutescens var. hirtella]